MDILSACDDNPLEINKFSIMVNTPPVWTEVSHGLRALRRDLSTLMAFTKKRHYTLTRPDPIASMLVLEALLHSDLIELPPREKHRLESYLHRLKDYFQTSKTTGRSRAYPEYLSAEVTGSLAANVTVRTKSGRYIRILIFKPAKLTYDKVKGEEKVLFHRDYWSRPGWMCLYNGNYCGWCGTIYYLIPPKLSVVTKWKLRNVSFSGALYDYGDRVFLYCPWPCHDPPTFELKAIIKTFSSRLSYEREKDKVKDEIDQGRRFNGHYWKELIQKTLIELIPMVLKTALSSLV